MEKDLFEPIKTYFEGYGYICDGEVNDIDLYMEKDGNSIAVELKETLDFKSVRQAALRQKITDTVFIGIFRPRDLYSSSFKEKIYLLKRLGIGLITVSKRTHDIEIVSEPVVTELSRYQISNKGKRTALASEFQRRKIKTTTGGVHHAKLMTAYREESLMVLASLSELGDEGIGRIVSKESGVKKATNIMYKNYYGWFEALGNGKYRITKAGFNALEEYKDTIKNLKKDDAD